MNYAAVNAKIKAMEARAPEIKIPEINAPEIKAMEARTPEAKGLEANGPDISDVAANICRYIQARPCRDYIAAMASPDRDINYYLSQWKRVAKLDKQSKVALKHILGTEIDITNILWMYRLKKYHRVKGNDTYGHLIPIRYRLTQAQTQHMADASNPQTLLEAIAQSPYSTDIDFTGATQLPPKQLSPEQQLFHAINKHYRRAVRRYPGTLATTAAYLYRLRFRYFMTGRQT